jgi:hypothetical protein
MFGIKGRTLLDIGAAKGISVQTYLEQGAEAFGTDISMYLEEARPDLCAGRVWQGDLGRPFEEWMSRKPKVMAPDKYWIVTCVECLEHIFPWRVPLAITNIARVTEHWFYATIPISEEWDHNDDHVCIRPERWWRGKFAEFAPNLRHMEIAEAAIKRVRLPSGMRPYEVWPWHCEIYDCRGEVPQAAINDALKIYAEGEELYKQGKAIYDGCEEQV